MKIKNIILFIVILIVFTACSYSNPTYEVFVKRYANFHIGKSFVPNNFGTGNRKIYSENRYIYISEYPKGCVVGFLTNRDDKPEVVQEWIIISGKEYCKDTETFILIQ
ncbi:hypothetical protein [Aliarcobacter butzleri]|uniref:hypothetical protein n=1 Tax=Aliarcobacter butzleri TaxID=28197 RepID=UPI001EE110EC|nr:hypothetical protein [Aliarcobacter butzleri]MCG3670088.1 hypothetical protein [Aliarcobacter butzleri]MDN5068554.1 hypothetical protein [Aliarcobacter butzleri]